MSIPAADWIVSDVPGREFAHWSGRGHCCFATEDWADVLRALGATPGFAWSDALGWGCLIARFRKGPLSLGICGFPVAGGRWDLLDPARRREAMTSLQHVMGLDVMRLNLCMQEGAGLSATAARPEAWISDLQTWESGASKRLRRDLALARRPEWALRVEQGVQGRFGFELYRQTVTRHGGTRRYGATYFETVARKCSAHGPLRGYTARNSQGDACAFSVMAIDHGIAYYLHGGATAAGRKQGASDLLLETMVNEARQAGCQRFTHLASPWDQPGLAAFKAKWSNRQGLSVTEDIAVGTLGQLARTWLRFTSRSERARGRAFSGSLA